MAPRRFTSAYGKSPGRALSNFCTELRRAEPACTRAPLWLSAVASLSLALSLPCPSAQAAKPNAKAAKAAKRAAKPAAAKGSSAPESKPSSTASSTAYETPSPGQSEVAPPPPPTTETKTKPSDSPSVEPAQEKQEKQEKKEPEKDLLKEASIETPPGATQATTSATQTEVPTVEEPEHPAEPVPLFVEHLGPSSYPGKLRGLYGGSMWLEPSFHGLQWPTMAKSGVGVSGSIWVDSGYEQITRDAKSLTNSAMMLQQGRAVLRVTPTYTDGNFFIQGQVELVGNLCQEGGSSTSSSSTSASSASACRQFGTFDTDDLWLRIGQWNIWDLKVGRFEGWELYHLGMGLDMYTLERQGAFTGGGTVAQANNVQAPTFYGLNYLHDRPQAGLGVGYLAFHGYLADYLRVELLGELGTDSASDTGNNYLGGRPSVIFDIGWLKIKGGGEYEKSTANTNYLKDGVKEANPIKRTRKGYGGSVEVVRAPYVEFGANIARGSQESVPLTDGVVDPRGSYTTTSVGGFANLRLAKLWLLGAGANWTAQTDTYYDPNTRGGTPDYSAHLQGFLAVQYMLAGKLFIKAVVGYARADFQDANPNVSIWSNTMLSGRVRLMYLY